MNDPAHETTPRRRQAGPGLIPEGAGPGRRKWAGLIFISLGVAMIIVDSTIVNVAIPQIIKDLGITSESAPARRPRRGSQAARAPQPAKARYRGPR